MNGKPSDRPDCGPPRASEEVGVLPGARARADDRAAVLTARDIRKRRLRRGDRKLDRVPIARGVRQAARLSAFLFLTAIFWVALFCNPVQFWIFDLKTSLGS
jgi:hypothetical protein